MGSLTLWFKRTFDIPVKVDDYDRMWANCPMSVGLSSEEISIGKRVVAIRTKKNGQTAWDAHFESLEYRQDDGYVWRHDGEAKEGHGLTTEAMIEFLKTFDQKCLLDCQGHVSQVSALEP
ncbi:MAG TPA: hypothetical protein PLK94_01860 [Alphaproteobacteria bacterium]|nr:hypothetical protein [Alphaproteobacteria bacterium]HOO50013.1 hypothetical protein [Alphaproteobacteria bacterium]